MKKTAKVLILDDDTKFAGLVAQVVRQVGADPLVVSSVEEFKAAYLSAAPDALVLDIVIANEDVCSAIDFAASRRCNAPVFVMSGYDLRMRKFVATVARDRGLHVADLLDKRDALPRLLNELPSYLVGAPPSAPALAV